MPNLTNKDIGKICRDILLDHLKTEWGPLLLTDNWLFSNYSKNKILSRFANFKINNWLFSVVKNNFEKWNEFCYLALLMREDNKLSYVLLNPNESKELFSKIKPDLNGSIRFTIYVSTNQEIYIREWRKFPVKDRIISLHEIPFEVPRSHRKETIPPKKTSIVVITPLERNRKLLEHLSNYGELTSTEVEQLGLKSEDISAWLQSLLVMRPFTKVVTPLFFWATEGDPKPEFFTTRLAIKFLGENLSHAVNQPLTGLEEYIWQSFGSWHLPQQFFSDPKCHEYLGIPTVESIATEAFEKLQLYTKLPSDINLKLVQDVGFLAELQNWNAKAAIKGLGPLSRQIKQRIRRPLFLSQFQLPDCGRDGDIELQSLPESEVLRRHYTIAGLPLCSHEEWARGDRLSHETILGRLVDHPLYALIVQFEVNRFMASISGGTASQLIQDHNGNTHLEVSGNRDVPLWQACRSLLTDLGFWPVTFSVNDTFWEASVRQATNNLEKLQVLEQSGDKLCLSEHFASEIKAHPGHSQNRGEKDFRIKLKEYFESLKGEAS